jgi:hypothetical protein
MAALPGSLARQPCPAALPGSLAQQPCPAALPGSVAEILPVSAVGRQNCKFFYGRRPACNIAYFYRPQFSSSFPGNFNKTMHCDFEPCVQIDTLMRVRTEVIGRSFLHQLESHLNCYFF